MTARQYFRLGPRDAGSVQPFAGPGLVSESLKQHSRDAPILVGQRSSCLSPTQHISVSTKYKAEAGNKEPEKRR